VCERERVRVRERERERERRKERERDIETDRVFVCPDFLFLQGWTPVRLD
jgi:hypothetical protein